ncbi:MULTISPECIES: MFS transporter [Staphylococcus]|jgi:MFS family permease|uniref:MFS transporter n=1 Tax=Staphylococcus TaxID=1279 RepID=UPI0007E3FCD8|nr:MULTISPECIES: MFS transporter [Staphylococcus]MDU7038938.1 MFS transporter [Lactococcus lactis]MDU7695965.1 MFS transporter [Staphylococcus sp.]MBF2265016.1 MFS transporter [Staphylococcus warneri]MBF2267398.1 MFS transporter [Staphylococcus warneri]MBF2272058.1 MFS transporter [Staphylococcus warneri]
MKVHSKNFRNLFYSQLFANIGDILYIVGLISYIYTITRSATSSALVPIIITIGMFISGFISPYIYQFLTKKNVLVIFQFSKIIIMLVIILTILHSNQILLIYILIFLNSFFDGFTNPVKNSMIPLIEKETMIAPSNAKMNTMNNTIQVGGWAIGGILLASIGYINIIFFTIFLYILSFIFILKLSEINELKEEKKSMIASFNSMLKKNISNKLSLFFNISTFIESFAHSVWIAAILLVYIQSFLNLNVIWFGFINSLFFGGMIFSGILVNFKYDIFQKKSSFIIISLPIIISILNASFAMHKLIIIALICSFLYGFFDETRTIILNSKLQNDLSSEDITQTYILSNMVYSFSFALSTLIISYIVDHSSVIYAFIIGGLSYLFVWILGMFFKKVLI